VDVKVDERCPKESEVANYSCSSEVLPEQAGLAEVVVEVQFHSADGELLRRMNPCEAWPIGDALQAAG
jgi:hypothetical protein